mmetsp:Transcript_15833/g.23818  ORF Transcript_15833/g.23818 Transcript_15833/m.23818 type:complete len:655 (+) Transcript_15833:51-2015(+)
MPEALEVFASYVQVWAFGQIVEWWNKDSMNEFLGLVEMALVLGAFFQPKKKVVPGLAFMIRIFNIFVRAPCISTPEYISALTDIPTMLCIVLRDPQKTTLLPSRAIRWQLAILYISSGIWKINSSYLHPRYSCASIQVLQFIDAFGLIQFSSLVAPIALALGAWLCILFEFAISIAIFLNEPAIAALLAIGLHALGALTPPPNNFGSLGVTCAIRLFWIAPFAMTRAWRNAVEYAEFAVHASVGAIFLAITVRKHPLTIHSYDIEKKGYASVDWAAGIFGVLASLVVRAALLHQRPDTRDAAIKKREGIVTIVAESSSPGVSCLALVLAIFYGIFAVSFGLLDIGTNTINSALRFHAGSNHLLPIPIGILQHAYYNQPNSIFSGGVLRIEHADSFLLNSFHPAEVTDLLAPGTRRLLVQHRHLGRLWNSALAIVRRGAIPSPPRYLPSKQWSTKAQQQDHATYMKKRQQYLKQSNQLPTPIPFAKYTLPAYELTRVLNLARRQLSTNSGLETSFRIVYARLDGISGDEQWRRHSITKLIQLDVDATGTNCTVLDSNFDDTSFQSDAANKHTSSSEQNKKLPNKFTHAPTHPPEAHHPEAAACEPEDFMDGRAWSTSLLNLIGRKFLASHSYPIVPRLTLSRYEPHADELSCYGV